MVFEIKNFFNSFFKGAISKAPFVFIVIAFFLGILFQTHSPISFSITKTVFAISIASIIFISLSLLFKQLRLLFLFLCFLFFGIFFTSIVHQKYFELIGKKHIIAKITSVIEEKEKTYKTEITSIQVIDETNTQTQAKAIIYIQKDSASKSLAYGDILELTANFQEIKNKPGTSFDYRAFAHNKFLYSQAYVTNYNWTKIGSETSFMSICNALRIKTLSIFITYGISQKNYDLLAALVFGDKSFLDSETTQAFCKVGAMHILSVSGLHVAIVSSILILLLSVFKHSRFLIAKTIISIIGIWIYASITGMSPSVQRAAVMCSMFSISILLQRKTSTYNTLACAAFISLIFNPNDLFDVGFQLSYIAVASILYFGPFFQNLFQIKDKVWLYIWGIVAISIAVQIGTLPISLYYFKVYPTYNILANIMVIPISFVVLANAMLFLAISIVPFLAKLYMELLNFEISYLLKVVFDITSFPHSSLQVELSFHQTLYLYGAILIGIISIEFARHLRIEKQMLWN